MPERSNETAGEHLTPREVIRLMVNLSLVEDDEVLSKPGVVRTIYDPTMIGELSKVSFPRYAKYKNNGAAVEW